MKKRLKKPLMVLTLLFVLVTALALPILAYSGEYGNLSTNMLNYEALTKAEFRLTDSYYQSVINNNAYSFNYRPDLEDGQWELYPYYTTAQWYAKSTSYIPFKSLFPYVKSGDNLILSYYSNTPGASIGGMYITVRDGTTDNGYPNEYNITTHYAIQVTDLMITQGYCEIRLTHNAQISNNLYLRALGAYSGQADLPSAEHTGTYSWKSYAQAIYTTWESTKEKYELLNREAYQDAVDSAFGNGYIEGKKDGYAEGKKDGYAEGVNDSDDTMFPSLLNGVFTAPMSFLTGLFDWDVFGVNIWSMVKGFLTLAVMLVVVRFVLKWVL